MRYQHADDLVVDLRALQRQLPASTPLRAGSGTQSAQDATTVVESSPGTENAPLKKEYSRFGWWIAGTVLLIIGAGIMLWGLR